MLKKDNIALKSVVIGLIIMLFASLIGGCSTLWIFHQITGSGVNKIRKIVYTDNMEKYTAGQTLVEEIKTSDTITVTFRDPQKSAAIDLGNQTYDIILSCDTSIEDVLGIGYTAEFGLWAGGDGSMVTLDNSYIFSGRIGAYAAGGGGQCTNYPGCTCGHLYDVFDKTCSHSYSLGSFTSDTRLTMEEAKTKLGIRCDACMYVSEVESNSKWTYYVEFNPCSMHFVHDGTFTRPLTKCIVYNISGQMSSFRFEELVLDGYDFTPLYDYVTTTDFGSTYSNWEQYYNPGDFSHMFSDLPVKKITIKNVKGLGERAKDFSSMFENCQNLEEVEFGNMFEGCKPTDISNMFLNCSKLKRVDLTTLDTSEVTNMSNMFATGRVGQYISVEEKQKMIDSYINESIIPMYLPELDDGTEWTFDDFYEFMIQQPGFEDISKEYGLFLLVSEFGLSVPLTYDELSIALYEMPFTDLAIQILEDPESLGIYEELNTYKDIVDYFNNELSLHGITDIVYDGLLVANKNRTELINYVINNVFVPIYLDPNDSTEYTLNTIVAKLNEVQTFSGEKVTKEKFLFDLVFETGIKIPLTWEELSLGLMGVEMDELVNLVNMDPSILELEPKLDGTPYTKEDIMEIFKPGLENYGMVVVTKSELKEIYNGGIPTATLILGGGDSKFVINEGTNISGMFGATNNFSTIVAPAEIHESITISLPSLYTNEEDGIGQQITSADANKTYSYHMVEVPEEEEPTDPEYPEVPNNPELPTDPEDTTEEENSNNAKTWLTPTEIIAISVGGGSVFLGCIVALILVIVVRKKPASRY